MRIDVHTHYYPPAIYDYLDRLGGFEELVGLKVLGRHRRVHWEKVFSIGTEAVLAQRFQAMDEARCDLQVVSLGGYHPYFRAPASATQATTFANDLYCELAAKYPKRFAVLACLPLPHLDASLAEIARMKRQKEVVGFILGCSAHEMTLDQAHFDPIWEALNELGAVVYLHPGAAMAGVPGADEFHLAPDFCSPSELAVCLCRLVVRGILERFPRIKFVAATTGGALPFLAHRFDHGLKQQNPEIHERLGGFVKQLRKIHVDTSVVEEKAVLKAAKELFGVDKIVLGSDAFRIEPLEAVRFIEDSEYLTPGEKAQILDVNAARLLDLPRRSPDSLVA